MGVGWYVYVETGYGVHEDDVVYWFSLLHHISTFLRVTVLLLYCRAWLAYARVMYLELLVVILVKNYFIQTFGYNIVGSAVHRCKQRIFCGQK